MKNWVSLDTEGKKVKQIAVCGQRLIALTEDGMILYKLTTKAIDEEDLDRLKV